MCRRREILRRTELVTGLGVIVIGILGCAYAVFGPTYRYAGHALSTGGSATTVGGSTSIVQRGLALATLVFLAVFLLILISFGMTSYWHYRWRSRTALTLIWGLVALLVVSVVISVASIGLFLVPAMLFAVVTAVLANLGQARAGT